MSSAVLYLYTDFVCPFCFIAEHSTVPRLIAEHHLALEWHGFELHPSTPKGGVPLSTLFPSAHLPTLHARTKAFAASFGVVDFEPQDWLSNTRRVLAAAEYARERDRLEAFRKAAFAASFRQGLNIEADSTLTLLAEAAGLDDKAVLQAASDPTYLGRVDERQLEARKAGISGIPTLVLGSRRAVGCQPYEQLESALGLAG
jgi:predicted DsbA family dithiol-disulfide isomerase